MHNLTRCFVWLAVLAAGWASDEPVRSSYILGPDDQFIIRALDAEEISDKPARIDMNGYISLPLVGRVPAAGLTLEQLEGELASRLKKYIKEPQVSVTVTEFRSQPVSVLGAVASPGVQQLRGRKTLFEMLSMAGGLRNDAGFTVKITRDVKFGQVPLSTAREDPSGRFSIADVNVTDIMEAKSPAQNIEIMPNDVISVPRADMVYVIGEVNRAGGFALGERENVTVLQALSLAEGLDSTAAAGKSRILRINPETASRVEIAVDLKKILAGKAQDVPMQSDDILFVPSSTGKRVAARTLGSIVSAGTGIAIWRGGRR